MHQHKLEYHETIQQLWLCSFEHISYGCWIFYARQHCDMEESRRKTQKSFQQGSLKAIMEKYPKKEKDQVPQQAKGLKTTAKQVKMESPLIAADEGGVTDEQA